MSRLISGLVAVIFSFVVLAPSASVATDPPEPPPVGCDDSGYCQGEVGGGGTGGPGDETPAGDGGPEKCVSKGKEIPCTSSTYPGFWSNDRACYVSPVSPAPPKSDPIWGGRTNGTVFQCITPGVTLADYFWSDSTPAGPDPRVLAERAIAAMQLRPVTIGIVPEDRPGRVGLVGMPVWMWSSAGGDQVAGPITRTASAAGFTVTATARLQRVAWNMGDGKTVVCHGLGTPYQDSYGKKSSPTCGHSYVRQGKRTVTATSYWVVEWSGIGQTGTIPLDLKDSTNVTIGEVQVLTQ